MRWVAFTLPPAEMASEAAVCLRSWAVILGNDVSVFWQRATALDSQERTPGDARYPPEDDVHSRSSRSFPSHVRANSSKTKAGNTTVRFLFVLRLPTIILPRTWVTLRRSSILRLRPRKLTSITFSATASPQRRP